MTGKMQSNLAVYQQFESPIPFPCGAIQYLHSRLRLLRNTST